MNIPFILQNISNAMSLGSLYALIAIGASFLIQNLATVIFADGPKVFPRRNFLIR